MENYQRFDKKTPEEIDLEDSPVRLTDGNGVVEAGHCIVAVDFNQSNHKEKETPKLEEFVDPAAFEPKNKFEHIRLNTKKVLDHLAFRAFTVILILLDLILVIVDLAQKEENKSLEHVSLAILSYFMLEVVIRIFANGPKAFFHHWIEVLDLVVVTVSFALTITFTVVENEDTAFARLVVAGRLIRIILIVRLVTEKKQLEKATRQIVSQNKRRYQKDGFDLDLCYITDNVIAMSFPSKGVMALYRNPIREVARFLELKHKDHYKIYNLCSERMYDESLFHYRVERVRIDDHNVPKLEDMLKFAASVHNWMNAHKDNVIAVHCKGGKGRTGTMICTWLVEAGLIETAKDSLDYFGDRRTDLSVGSTFQGVETPSQSRYVEYFEMVKKKYDGKLPILKKLALKTIIVKHMEGIADGTGHDLSCRVISDDMVHEYSFGPQTNCKTLYDKASCTIQVEVDDICLLGGDIKVMFHSSSTKVPRNYDDCAFYLWFHTSFVDDNRLWLSRDDLDNPHKSKTWDVFRQGFGVELIFQETA